MTTLSHIKEWSEIAQSVLTSLALVVGGSWTYYNFIYKRERWPKAEFQVCESSYVNGEQIYLSVKIHIKNIGQLLLPIDCVVTRVQQVSPLTHDYRPRYHPNEEGVVLDWPTLVEKTKTYHAGELELEPNETHEFDFDFLLAQDTRIIKVTAYIPNIRKSKRGIGWLASSIHSIAK
jgi:hypothetical protein